MLELSIFSRNLTFLRKARGDTQAELAASIEKTKENISAYETGRAKIGVDDLMKLSEYFQISETELLRRQFWRCSDEEIEQLRNKWANEAVLETDTI